jgi:hypothetical protein
MAPMVHRAPFRASVALLVLALGSASCESPTAPSGESLPAVEQSEPGPGEPPVLWLGGVLEEISDTQLAVREGEGPRLVLERFAGGATTFFQAEGGTWRPLSEEEAGLLEVGQRVCVEAILDEGAFLALRVFLGSGCGPVR